MIHWNLLDELSGQEVYELFMLRQQVFMIEQNCLYQDIDKSDSTALHCRYLDKNGKLCGYLRVISPSTEPSSKEQNPAIGRVAVNKKYRRQGIAEEMMESAMQTCEEQFPNQKIRLAAQTYLIDFYSRFGFMPIGREYIEDDIPHQDMQSEI